MTIDIRIQLLNSSQLSYQLPYTHPHDNYIPAASFTKEINPGLAKCLLVFNGCLANHGLTSLVKEREIKFISLLGDRGHRGPYSPYKSCNHNLYIGIIIFPHIDNPKSTGYNWPKKKTIKMINEKSEGPINLTNHWRKRLWISLHMDLKILN